MAVAVESTRRAPSRTFVHIAWCGAALLVVDLATKRAAGWLSDASFIDETRTGEALYLAARSYMLWATPMSMMISAALLLLTITLRKEARVSWWTVALLGAGAVGTTIDLIAYGNVRAWLIVGPSRWNLALVCLLISLPPVLVATVKMLREPESGRPIDPR